MSNRINSITIIIIILIVIGWYFDLTSLYYLIPVAVIYIITNIIGSIRIQHDYFFHSHCNGSTTKNEIAITFDDGPHHEVTPKLIELLDTYNVKATFFCIGKNAKSYPKIINEIFKKGHLIGNHTYGHFKLFDLLSSGNMRNEIIKTNNVLASITGKTPLLFRPPYGVTNPMLKKAINKTQMVSIGWSLRSLDTVKNPKDVIAKLVAKTKRGDIVLFHDTNTNILPIIEEYLLWLKDNDFKIVSLTSLLNISAYEE